MPIYEYFCPNCQRKFELLRPMKCANYNAVCPACNSNGQKLMSKFSSLSKDAAGVASPIAGSDKCSSCTAANCSYCG